MKRKLLDQTHGPGVDAETGIDSTVRVRVYSNGEALLTVRGNVDDVWRAYLLAFSDDPDAEWDAYLAEKTKHTEDDADESVREHARAE